MMKTYILWSTSLALAACGAMGNGDVTTSTRPVPAFRRVSIESGIDAYVVPGSRSVAIRTDRNLQALVESVVERDTLVLRVKPYASILSATDLSAEVSNDLLEGLDASGAATVTMTATPVPTFPIRATGASRVEVSRLASAELEVDASGGSEVTVRGAAARADIVASGASRVWLTELPLTASFIDASGASRVEARVSEAVSGSATGASEIVLLGTPDQRLDVSGASTVVLGAR